CAVDRQRAVAHLEVGWILHLLREEVRAAGQALLRDGESGGAGVLRTALLREAGFALGLHFVDGLRRGSAAADRIYRVQKAIGTNSATRIGDVCLVVERGGRVALAGIILL